MPNLLLLDRKKITFRIYVIISNLKVPIYSMPSLNVVKLAPRPYQEGTPESEICNTSYSKRLGLPPTSYVLDHRLVSKETGVKWNLVKESINNTVNSFMHTVAWKARKLQRRSCLLLWGLDIIIQNIENKYYAILLEVNHFPQIYRNHPSTDLAMDKMLSKDFFPSINK